MKVTSCILFLKSAKKKLDKCTKKVRQCISLLSWKVGKGVKTIGSCFRFTTWENGVATKIIRRGPEWKHILHISWKMSENKLLYNSATKIDQDRRGAASPRRRNGFVLIWEQKAYPMWFLCRCRSSPVSYWNSFLITLVKIAFSLSKCGFCVNTVRTLKKCRS